MRLKIRCDEKSWKVFEFWVELKQSLMYTAVLYRVYT